jgi:iron(III) transport system ATP-binding protein
MSYKVELVNVTKKYESVVALNDVSLKVKEKEIVSLLGPSGCGKTTLLRCIAGLEEINKGQIYISGSLVSDPAKKIFVPPEKRNIGFVFQNYALWPHMTVFDNIAFPLKVRKLPQEEIKKRVKKVLELVELEGLERRYPTQLSGGEQQRVALARSLVYEPQILLLDEPLSNLDAKIRERVRSELSILLRKVGITAIYSTHDQEEAFAICDKVVIMNEGRIIQEGTPYEIYENPVNKFVAEFIGKPNIFAAKIKEVYDDGTCVIEVPELETNLICDLNNSNNKIKSSNVFIAIRSNEIGIYDDENDVKGKENILKGKILYREYRGHVTDHFVQVSKGLLKITTHKYCGLYNLSNTSKEIFVYIRPHSIKIISHN